MNEPFSRKGLIVLFSLFLSCLMLALSPQAHASTAYGTLNNFDCVNDTGVDAHGFEIELDDLHSTDITYTYDYNHYGVPKITQDNADPAHPKVFVRYASAKNPDGTWAAYTAIPSGPIAPTQGHQFTNPSVNFGGEHFGVGYYGSPSAVKNNWLIDDGTGNLVHGPPVNVSTPTFTYNPPAGGAPAFVVPVIVPPPPPVLPPLRFGEASWIKEIKTTTHNPVKVPLERLVGDDPGQPQPWANGEPSEVEMEWKLLQTEFANAANPKGNLRGGNEKLPGGNEIVTRRYEFYKYLGPLDAETGEAMADAVGKPDPDGVHFFGTGSVTFADHFDNGTGEWVTKTVDLSTVWVVGKFFGAQMSSFDVAPALGLVDHVQDGELNVAYPNRTVVVPGSAPFLATLKTGSPPDGLTFDEVTGILSGTPVVAGTFAFTIEASDTAGALVSKAYTLTVPAAAVVTGVLATSASPVGGGTTSGDGTYNSGANVTVTATANPGYGFVNWTENGAPVSNTVDYQFTAAGNRTLVANFVRTFTVTVSSLPVAGGTVSGGGVYKSGSGVTVTATANPGYTFVNWTEGATIVGATATLTVPNVTSAHNYSANFAPNPVDGACGPANGAAAYGVPTMDLCAVGTPSLPTGSGPWSWACNGTFGGVPASCSAPFFKPGDCGKNGTVTVFEVQSAINMFLGLKTSAACADLDKDGAVSISEVQKAIESFLGL